MVPGSRGCRGPTPTCAGCARAYFVGTSKRWRVAAGPCWFSLSLRAMNLQFIISKFFRKKYSLFENNIFDDQARRSLQECYRKDMALVQSDMEHYYSLLTGNILVKATSPDTYHFDAQCPYVRMMRDSRMLKSCQTCSRNLPEVSAIQESRGVRDFVRASHDIR